MTNKRAVGTAGIVAREFIPRGKIKQIKIEMESPLEEIRDQQKASWDKFSPGWKKWDDMLMDFHVPVGEEMIRLIHPGDKENILDVASGTGEPGLTIATRYPGCKVVITDLSHRMVDISREHASMRGIKNVEFHACDVSELPFADNSFDAITCRMGFMFFPDMLLAARELVRVLKPGGRIAASVWNVPEKNFWITVMAGAINRNMQLPPVAADAPGIFRCAKSGLMEGLFKQAGLKHTSEREVPSALKCGTAEVYWNMITEVAAPFVAILSKADDAVKDKIRKEVIQLINDRYAGRNVEMEAGALVIYGEK